MNTDSGCVIMGDLTGGTYAVWKHYRTKECYLVIRGTKDVKDFLADIDVEEINDDDIGAKVHNGVKKEEILYLLILVIN